MELYLDIPASFGDAIHSRARSPAPAVGSAGVDALLEPFYISFMFSMAGAGRRMLRSSKKKLKSGKKIGNTTTAVSGEDRSTPSHGWGKST